VGRTDSPTSRPRAVRAKQSSTAATQPGLRAFICSTYQDLSNERSAVVETIKKLRLGSGAMEFFGAKPGSPIESCLDEVRRSDLLIVIIGHLYGSLVPDRRISFTEAEYQEAQRHGKPCLVYLLDADVPVKPAFVERDPIKIRLLDEFKAALRTKHTVDTFRSDRELAKKLATALKQFVDSSRVDVPTKDRHIDLLRTGARAWNDWRSGTARRRGATEPLDLAGIDLRGAALEGADLSGALLAHADLSGADLSKAKLRRADLSGARLVGADLRYTLLEEANLSEANLTRALLSNALLRRTNLAFARMIETDLRGARLEDCHVFGVAAWSINSQDASQSGLIITSAHEATVTVDDIEFAQLNYLVMRSGRAREFIDSLQSRTVLVLGRFPAERKGVLDVIQGALRRNNLVPVVFDFERASARDLTESVMTMAGMSSFIVADITHPRATPLELNAILPNYPVPMVPLIAAGEEPYAMFHDLRKYAWVLPPVSYASAEQLDKHFDDAVIRPAIRERERHDARRGRTRPEP
jgi:uncharacterized protein YjbI with pentapeptide repeats